MGNIEKAVQFAEKIAADDSHGYSQANRLGNPDYDCSSLVAAALRAGGYDVAADSFTGNLYQQLINNGFKSIDPDAPRKRGDIFLTPYSHVVMCIDPDHIVHASISENGGIYGKAGDQTGKEICTRTYYRPSGGWKYHLRAPESDSGSSKKSIDEIAKEVIAGKWGNGEERRKALENAGYKYNDVQSKVNEILSSKKSTTEIAQEVIAGKWGNMPERKQRLEAAGYNYNTIRNKVNQLLKG